jgi:hypothetical protein
MIIGHDAQSRTKVVAFRHVCRCSRVSVSFSSFPFHVFLLASNIHLLLVDDKPTWRTKFLKYIYLSTSLYMFRALCAHHQERSNCTNTTSALVTQFTYSAHKTHSKMHGKLNIEYIYYVHLRLRVIHEIPIVPDASVSLLTVIGCARFLYSSSPSEKIMVEHIKKVVAVYEEFLRRMQFVPRCS